MLKNTNNFPPLAKINSKQDFWTKLLLLTIFSKMLKMFRKRHFNKDILYNQTKKKLGSKLN